MHDMRLDEYSQYCKTYKRMMGMPEKKTFKNPGISSYNTYHAVGVNDASYPVEVFSKDNWDMEVTFTKKEKPFVPGYYRPFVGQNLTWFYTKPTDGAWVRVKVEDVSD